MAVPAGFRERWASGRHVGPWRPVMKVYVREIYMDKEFWDWPGPPVGAKIPGESLDKPWRAKLVPRSAWMEVPGVLECQVTQDFSQEGMQVTTLNIENILYREGNNMGYIYHMVEKGALSPWRGYTPPGRPSQGVAANEWYDLLAKNAQIKVFMGYGSDFLVPVFTGLIDDTDLESTPTSATVVARDFGQLLIEQRIMGLNNGPKIGEPCIFAPEQPDKLWGVGEQRGYAARASSSRDGYPPRFIVDQNAETSWISDDRANPDDTEWVDIRLPRGRYESFWLRPRYPGMEAWVGFYVRDNNMGGEPPTLDDLAIANGWVVMPADEGGGVTPGSVDGGWPYLKHYPILPVAGQYHRLDCKIVCGDDSLLRVGFRKLYRIREGVHRAGVFGFTGIRRKSATPVLTRQVGFKAEASSQRSGYPPKEVLDQSTKTRWISADHRLESVTEYVEIHLPQGRYHSFRVATPYRDMTMYISVFARPRRRKKKKGKGYEYYPSLMDGVEIPDGFINVPPYEQVPGGHGGHACMKRIEGVGPHKPGKTETFKFDHRLDLGYNSVLRISWRKLHRTSPDVHRASVSKLKANTRTGVDQPPKPPKEPKKIIVNDPSDIVRVCLRWAGFEEWEIENTGAKLQGEWHFGRDSFLIDPIKKVQEVTGFIFYMKPPSEVDASIGIPVFRQSLLLADDLPDVPTVTEDLLLSGVKAKITDEPLATIYYVRGAPSATGAKYGADKTKRIQAKYVPPWHRFENSRLSGSLRHVVKTEKRLTTQQAVDVYARLWALRSALEAATAVIAVPGSPEFELDEQIGVLDSQTGLSTRLYLAQRTMTFHTGENASWKLSLGGALLDTPDITAVKAELRALLPASVAVPFVGEYYIQEP